MKRTHHLIAAAAAAFCLTAGSAIAQEALRAEVGRPLQAAQELIKANKYKEALAKIRDADAVSGKSAHESLTVERMRFVAANGAGDADAAAKSLEALSASGKLSAGDQLKFTQAVAVVYYRDKSYAKAIAWTNRYFKEGGSDGQMRTLLAQSYYLNNDFAGAAREINAELHGLDKTGGKPGEDRLQMLAHAYVKLNDMNGYTSALERLVTHYPKKEYWADLLNRTQKKSNFADRLALDLYRLKLAHGDIGGAGDYMEMAQLALQQGYPAEAKKVVDAGYASKVLGEGGEAARHQRLRDLVAKQLADDQKNLAQGEAQAKAAKDGTGLVNMGFNYVLNGQYDKGLAMMEQGIAKGGLKRLDDARLRLAYGYLQAGQKARAQQAFKAVQGSDGTADLARLWLLQMQQ